MVLLPNATFLHIPKTGGQWVRKALVRACPEAQDLERDKGSRHAITADIKNLENPFCFVRHPLTWYQSYWSMRSENNSWDIGVPIDSICRSDNFEHFIERVLERYEGVGNIYPLFQNWLNHCNMVGKMEDLPYSLILILDIVEQEYDFGAIMALQRVNVGTTHKDKAIYGPGQVDRVLQMDRAAIEAFEY